jgi:beta-alanine--pyruvate transaminase
VLVRRDIHDAFMAGPPGIELFHGYTYSGHPLAAAAAVATLEAYAEEGLFARAAALEAAFGDAAHGLRGRPHVVDIRTLGLVAGIELEPRPGAPGARGYEVFVRCFEAGVLVRVTGDTIALSPPLIIEANHIERLFATLARVLGEVG